MNLNRENFPRELQIGASAPEATGIVHIGTAQFHRAHAAVATAQALAAEPGDWGIVGVASHNPRIVEALRAQDGLYSILQLTPEGESAGIVDVHRRFAVAAQDPDGVVGLIAEPRHRILTLTVSEGGYHRDARTGGLDRADPGIAADLAGEGPGPVTSIGLVARGLMRRFADGGAPLTVLSCDNMLSAGDRTRSLVAEFLREAGAAEDLFAWMDESVTFPNGMVDRIVPAPTDATREAVVRLIGCEDAVPVLAEGFTMWVLEDRFAAGRPAWEHAEGVVFSDEVGKYELVKLRLLNGSHSLIAYLGALDGRETIPDSRMQPFVEECVRNAIRDEYLPSIDLPDGFDPDAYIARLFDRWTNVALGDRTSRVGSDGSSKLLDRIPEPAIRLLKRGVMPQQMALTAAAWIACACPPAGFDPGPVASAMTEPKRAALAAAVAALIRLAETARAVEELAGALSASFAAAERVYALVDAPVEVPDGDRELLARPAHDVIWEDVVYTYPGAGSASLHGVSLHAAEGEWTCLVGVSGSGKTTLAGLAVRTDVPQYGRVLIDDVDVAELTGDSLRREVALVSQRAHLFRASVADNVRLARPEASDEDVVGACRAACVHDDIMAMASGYDTLIGERGASVSGGQRQRLALARALLAGPSVLILDEFTSHLDPGLDNAVRASVRQWARGCTIIEITHRLAHVGQADHVVVLDGGRVVQDGPPDELMSEDGPLRRLMDRG